MKTRLLPILTTSILAVAPSLRAAPVVDYFSDTFDGAPYSDNAALVLGAGELAYGFWSSNHINAAGAVTSTSQAYSGTRSMALQTFPGGEGEAHAQVVGTLSSNGSTRTPATDGLSMRFAFQMADATFATTFYIASDSWEQSVLLTLSSQVRSYHNNASHVLNATLSADTWYVMEILLPDTTFGTDHEYTVSLYNAAGGLIDSYTDLFQSAAALDYTRFTFYHSSNSAQTFYLDSMSVTSIPEGSTAALLLSGLGAGALVRLKSRRRVA